MLGGDEFGGAGSIVDNHRLLPRLAEFLGQRARHHVHGAAGGIPHDHAHGAGREILCERGKRGQGTQNQASNHSSGNAFHSILQ